MTTTPPPASGSHEEQSARPRQRSWLKWLLTASLALNALFIGGLVGAVWRHGGPPGSGQTVPGNMLTYAETLPRVKDRETSARAKEYRRILLPMRRALQDARREIVAAVATEPFDRARYVAAQKRLSDVEVQLRSQQAELLADIAGSLSADERRAYGRWWEHRRARFNRGRGQGDDDTDPPAKK